MGEQHEKSENLCSIICYTGPLEWPEVAMTCGGRAQSPINIVTKKTLKDDRLQPLRYNGYQFAFHSDIINNGHSGKSQLNIIAWTKT